MIQYEITQIVIINNYCTSIIAITGVTGVCLVSSIEVSIGYKLYHSHCIAIN